MKTRFLVLAAAGVAVTFSATAGFADGKLSAQKQRPQALEIKLDRVVVTSFETHGAN